MPGSELQLIREDVVVRVVPIEEEPVTVGRDLGNTVALLADDVSTHHAVVMPSPAGLEVRDLHSTNGTFVNDRRIEDRSMLSDGDVLRFGASVRFRVCLSATTDRRTMILEHLTAGTAHLLDDERYRIGSAPKSHLVLPDGPEVAGTLIAHANGEVWLGTADGETQVEPGTTFELGTHRFQLTSAPSTTPSTVWGCREARYGYQLRLGSTTKGSLYAQLHDPSSGTRHAVGAENRIALLTTLGRRLKADLETSVTPSEAGWTHDEDVLIAVWGRAGFRNASSTYSVLLHRLRKEVEEAGFDPWFIEKKRGAIRLRLKRIELESQG